MARCKGFVCISFSLAGDGKKKSRDSPVFALAHAQATGLCGQHSNPPARQERAAQTGGPLLARCKGFEPLTFWSVARRSIQLS